MKKLIEIFMWQYEGEYAQYFFTTNNEKQFIKDTLKYLNNTQNKKEYPWSEPLGDYAEEQQVESLNLMMGDTPHLREIYYIDYDGKKFNMSKMTYTHHEEKIE